jgi:hypothetical protein
MNSTKSTQQKYLNFWSVFLKILSIFEAKREASLKGLNQSELMKR